MQGPVPKKFLKVFGGHVLHGPPAFPVNITRAQILESGILLQIKFKICTAVSVYHHTCKPRDAVTVGQSTTAC